MLRALRTFREVGCRYMIMPVHFPSLSGAVPKQVGVAYIRALLQAVTA